MRFKILFLFIGLVQLGYSQEQLTQTIKGTVIDKQSKYEIPGARIEITSTPEPMLAGTDIYGSFRIENVPIGRHTLKVSSIGYKTVTLSNLTLNSAKELDMKIELEEDIEMLDAVVIKSNSDKRETNNDMTTVSGRTFSIEEAGRFSGTIADPARMAQNYAGVSGASDDRNDIIIRGNSPTGVLWRLEGIDIPSPNHFSTMGTTGGPISMLNINNLSNSDFMTSAFSADYGNALAGVFDLRLRKGNSDKREYLGQIGFNGFELGAEGPFKKGKRASYLINYRYSTLEVFDALGIDLGTGAAIPEYQDVTFNVDVPTAKAGKFTLFGIAGTSFINIDAEEVGDNNLFSEQNESSRFRSTTGIFGLSHTYFLNPKTFSKLVLASSLSYTSGKIDYDDYQNNINYNLFGFKRQQLKYSYNYKINKKINAKNTIVIGTMGDYYDLDMVDSARVSPNTYLLDTDFKGGSFLFQNYALWKHRFTEALTLNSGIHSQHFIYTNSHVVEPRIGLKYQVNSKHNLSVGTGMHSQLQPLTVYFVQEQQANGGFIKPNENLAFTKAFHGVFGHDWLITNDLRLKTELYYQHLYQVPIDTASSSFSMLNEGADFVIPDRTGIVNEGTGRNYGLEVTLEKFFNKGYYYLTTVSLFQSKYTGSDNIERNTAFNSNYVLNALAGKEFNLGKNSTLSLDTKVTYTGGRKFTPVLLDESNTVGYAVYDYANAFSGSYDPYFKWDFKITYKHNGKKVAQQFSLDINNVTNQKNVFQQTYSSTSQSLKTTYQRGFFPVVLYKIYF